MNQETTGGAPQQVTNTAPEQNAPLTTEQVATQVGGKIVDEWDQGEEIKAGWVKLEVGEFVKGTLVNKRVQKSNIADYPDQWVYEIKKEEDGAIVFIGFAVNKTFINNKLKNLQIGQIVMIKRFADVPSKKFKEKDGSPKMAASYDARLFGMDENYTMQDDGDDGEINVEGVPFK